MSLSLEAAAGPVSSYHLDPRLEDAAGVLSLKPNNFCPADVIRQQVRLEVDKLRCEHSYQAQKKANTLFSF